MQRNVDACWLWRYCRGRALWQSLSSRLIGVQGCGGNECMHLGGERSAFAEYERSRLDQERQERHQRALCCVCSGPIMYG